MKGHRRNDEALLTPREVAELFDTDVDKVVRLARKHWLPCIWTPGHRRRFREALMRELKEAGWSPERGNAAAFLEDRPLVDDFGYGLDDAYPGAAVVEIERMLGL